LKDLLPDTVPIQARGGECDFVSHAASGPRLEILEIIYQFKPSPTFITIAQWIDDADILPFELGDRLRIAAAEMTPSIALCSAAAHRRM
jgi:hypothetical protein